MKKGKEKNTKSVEVVFKLEHKTQNFGMPLIIFFKAKFNSFDEAIGWVKKNRKKLKRVQEKRYPDVKKSSNIWIMENGRKPPNDANINLIHNPWRVNISFILTLPPYTETKIQVKTCGNTYVPGNCMDNKTLLTS